MAPKRPIRNVFGNDDDDASAPDNTPNGTPPKKPRPDSKSTIHRIGVAPPTSVAAPQNGAAGIEANSIQAQVAAAKARAQALMSAMQNKGVAGSSTARPPAAPAPAAAAAMPASRFAPVASTSNGRSTAASAPPPSAAAAAAAARAAPAATASTASIAAARPSASGSSSIQAQLEAARAKVQAQMAALNSKSKAPAAAVGTSRLPATQSFSGSNGVAATPSAATSTPASTSKAPTGIHPLLLSSELPYKSREASSTATAQSTSYVKGKSSIPPESNPYLLATLSLATEASGPKQRSMHKGFHFHKPGRHVREAEELRREQQMEELKRRIEESARKAGMQDELADEKRLLRPPPPEIEWWDANLVSTGSYQDVPDAIEVEAMLESAKQADSRVLIYGEKSPIDHYVQHPVPIPAPSDSIAVQPRGLMLTKREQRKLRRQRRAAEQQDKRDRIKMGLLPPEPPKVKLSNLMRVLTSEAVSDPTKIEARVRREIAARKEAHERANLNNKLTDQQRRDKVERKKSADEQKGLYCQVYKVKHLISPRHKFKVRRNALDHGLTGVTVFHPSMALVVVEGSAKALKKYKRLMTVRIDWTDPGEPTQPDTSDKEDDDDPPEQPTQPNSRDGTKVGFRTLTTSEEHVDWPSNTCELIFEGPIRQRYWTTGFRARGVETDQAARDVLGDAMQGYWDVAKRASQSSIDAF